MLEALATSCHDYDACWRPVAPPDGYPFVSLEVTAVWTGLLLLSVIVFLRRLGRD